MRALFIYTIGLLVMATACQKRADLQLPYEGNKVVLNTFIQADSPVYIRVTKSEPVAVLNDLNFKELPQAQVTILENGLPFDTAVFQQILGRGYFVTQKTANRGKHYTVLAAVPGMGTAHGADSIPMQPVVHDLSALKGGNQVKFILKDPAGIKNYYRIHLYEADSVDGGLKAKQRIIYRLDPSFSNNFADIISDSYYDDIVIKDERFEGSTVQFVLQTAAPVNYRFLMAQVVGVSEGGYKYLQTANQQQTGSDDEGNVLTPPVKVYSNVENGYGIVAGMYASWINCKVR